MNTSSEAKKFLSALYETKSPSSFILIWEKHTNDSPASGKKISYWFDNPDKAVEHIGSNNVRADVYVGCGLAPQKGSEHTRCKAADIIGIPGVWLDIDVADPSHKKNDLPQTQEDALSIIKDFPLQPTFTIHSGHGFQCWWLFDKVWEFRDKDEHDDAAELVRQFTWSIRDKARSMGYNLDMTFDLSRVLRIPGGKNWKDKDPLPVQIVQANPETARYTIGKFRESLAEFQLTLGDKATKLKPRVDPKIVEGLEFTIDPKAEPNKIQFDALYEYDQKFRLSWEKKRRDLKDDSPSGYDLSLASFAANAGWDIQQIVNLIIAFRRKHNHEFRDKEDYYRRTYFTATNALQKSESLKNLKENADNLNDEPQDTEKILFDITKALKFERNPIRQIIKYDMDPVEYRIQFQEGSIHIGASDRLIGYHPFRKLMVDAADILIPRFKTEQWDALVQNMLNVAVKKKLSEDMTNRGIVVDWIVGYLSNNDPSYNPDEAIVLHKPFFYDKYLVIHGPALRAYLKTFQKEDTANKKSMGFLLNDFGFVSKGMNFRKRSESGQSTFFFRTVWLLDITKDKTFNEFLDQGMLDHANKERADAAEALHHERTKSPQ